ncbi:MAG: methyl-accepting chemotaxis protein [Nocardioides sp.]
MSSPSSPPARPASRGNRRRFNPRSLRFRLVVTVLGIVSVILMSLIGLVSVRTSALARGDANDYTRELAGHEAANVSQRITEGLDTVRTMASVLGTLKTTGASRKDVSAVLRDVLAKHPEFVGVSTCWEPNAFDGKDARYAGTSGSDASGRLIPYWYHDGGVIKTAPLEDYEKPGVGDWYLVPRATGKETVVDPYSYRVGDKDVLMTTAVAPIIVHGKFVGVATADMGLTDLSAALGAVRPYGTGYAALVTASGTVVAHPDAGLLGKPLAGPALDDAKRAAASGDPVVVTGHDSHLGEQALTVYQPVRLGTTTTWALALTAPTSSVLAKVSALKWLFIVLALLGLAAAAVLAWLTARSATRPIRRLRDRLAEIASGDGDLTQRVDESRGDELGELGAEFNRFTEKIARLVVQIQERATVLTASADQLADVSSRLSEGAHLTATQTSAASDTVGAVSQSVSTVASGAEEMGASIREISASATEAATVGGEAVDTARTTETTVAKLGDSSSQIGEVVKVITSIAEQTNLLALNATIEAARAGDAGKGFAVVAGEVKELARETANATERISRLVDAIQHDTQDAVSAIGHISAVIARVNDYQMTIASAVEEQTAVTSEMSRGAADAASRATEIAEVVGTVATGTEHTTRSSIETGQAAAEITAMAAELQDLVGQFRVTTG